ncbi:hypothetical protein AB1Y20_007069 [Prymnesium parvum]|uniref:Snurportin-1 n=1 Tax=Prymnesium parvum TaxID=97485 RepID=A0AB34IZV9_PRYPA
MIAEAVAMVQEGSTLRRAADAVNQKYSSDGRGIKVSYSSVYSRFKDPAYQPQSKGKQAYLPEEFDHKICDFVLALRALKWPVFKDQVVAIANHTLQGSTYFTKFKDQQLAAAFALLPTHAAALCMERRSIKARSSQAEEQRRRRAHVLSRQKERREASLALARGAPLSPAPPPPPAAPPPLLDHPFDEPDDDAASVSSLAAEGRGGARRSRRRVANGAAARLSAAEWMVDVPADLAERWFVGARPAGTRCLVTSGGGSTRALARRGAARAFPSALPGGCRARGKAFSCELDCIWHEQSQTYFVLDILGWKGSSFVDCPAEFRFFWRAAKLEEAAAAVRSSSNPCAFVAVDFSPCSTASVGQAYAAPLPYERDGLLFVHRDGLYEPGPSPLVLSWSDEKCSARFYNYGTEKMAAAISKDPQKAERWRASEIEAAISIDDIIACIEQPEMVDAEHYAVTITEPADTLRAPSTSEMDSDTPLASGLCTEDGVNGSSMSVD